MMILLMLPLFALVFSSSPATLLAGINHRLFKPALLLSARTSVISLFITILLGTPLAWWLAQAKGKRARLIQVLVDLPIVIPPAVMGIALLQTFGRNGLLGPLLNTFHLQLVFTTNAVILAQVLVSSPFYIQSGISAFRRVDPDLLLVARTLGHSSRSTFFRVVIPLALPGLISGAALAWARSLGEFGATLLFAGNRIGRTQTMPLAIFHALETDVRVAVAISLVLAAIGMGSLFMLRTTSILR